MSTPAEIIAARVNGIIRNGEDKGSLVNSVNVSSDSEEVNSVVDESDGSLNTSVPSISDESAFPTLGGKKTTQSHKASATWGPMSKSASPSGPSVSKVKASVIQDAFTLDVEDQLNVARPEFIKILTNIKAETKTNIECTTSLHTKKRTFLISGKPESVKLARRLVIKKLTKPIKISFLVPAKLRSKIIGLQGKTLKPILQENDVKIDIDHDEILQEDVDDEDDIFAKAVKVTIEGDVEGCKHAKAQILAIVREEIKHLSIRFTVSDIVKPFAAKHLEPITSEFADLSFSIPDFYSSINKIHIVGDREAALQAKSAIQDALELLEKKLVVEEVPIPKTKHQFLPIEKVLGDYNVLIQLPNDDNLKVKFIGQRANLKEAMETARKTTSQYKVEILEMSKAHKGNISHVKSVAALLIKNNKFDDIAKANDVKIDAPSLLELENSSFQSIPIKIIAKTEEEDKIKSAKKAIVSAVNKVTPSDAFIIDDIDKILIPKVPATIGSITGKHGIQFVILNGKIVLFASGPQEESEDFDFEENNGEAHFKEVNDSLNKLRELASNINSIVLNIASDKQNHLKGPNGTTLSLLLSEVESDSMSIKLHYNGKEESPDSVFLHGYSASVDKVKTLIESILSLSASELENYSTSIEIPSNVISRIIGKNGSNLISLREKFGTKIDVSDKDSEENKELNSNASIKISGPKFNVEECEKAIVHDAKRWADETTRRLRIENEYHKRLIGPNWLYINKLQDKYNVKIRFPPTDGVSSAHLDAPKLKDEVTIRGSSKNVKKAEEELMDLYKYEKENGYKETLKIPVKAIARVIGKSGETIKDISDGFGVEYKFNRNQEFEDANGFTEVLLIGSKSSLKSAREKILDIVNEVENTVKVSLDVDPKYYRELIGQGGSVLKEIISKAGGDDVPRNKYFKLLSIPNEGSENEQVTSEGDKKIVDSIIKQVKDIVAQKKASVTENLDLPKEKHKLIVGPLGTIRHSIQDKYSVVVDIPRPNDKSTIVKVSGLPENVEKALEEIKTLTKDDWNVSVDVPSNCHAFVSERGAIFKRLLQDYDVRISHGNLTRKASALSKATVPVPENAYPAEEEKTKFTISANEDNSKAENIPWRLKGSIENTEKVAKILNDRLEEAKNANYSAWFYSLDPSQFAKLIGPQGSTISEIRKKSGCVISVPKAGEKSNEFIYLVGSENGLKEAQKLIENLLA